MNELKTCCTALYVNMCGGLNGFNLTLIFKHNNREGKYPPLSPLNVREG